MNVSKAGSWFNPGGIQLHSVFCSRLSHHTLQDHNTSHHGKRKHYPSKVHWDRLGVSSLEANPEQKSPEEKKTCNKFEETLDHQVSHVLNEKSHFFDEMTFDRLYPNYTPNKSSESKQTLSKSELRIFNLLHNPRLPNALWGSIWTPKTYLPKTPNLRNYLED